MASTDNIRIKFNQNRCSSSQAETCKWMDKRTHITIATCVLQGHRYTCSPWPSSHVPHNHRYARSFVTITTYAPSRPSTYVSPHDHRYMCSPWSSLYMFPHDITICVPHDHQCVFPMTITTYVPSRPSPHVFPTTITTCVSPWSLHTLPWQSLHVFHMTITTYIPSWPSKHVFPWPSPHVFPMTTTSPHDHHYVCSLTTITTRVPHDHYVFPMTITTCVSPWPSLLMFPHDHHHTCSPWPSLHVLPMTVTTFSPWPSLHVFPHHYTPSPWQSRHVFPMTITTFSPWPTLHMFLHDYHNTCSPWPSLTSVSPWSSLHMFSMTTPTSFPVFKLCSNNRNYPYVNNVNWFKLGRCFMLNHGMKWQFNFGGKGNTYAAT